MFPNNNSYHLKEHISILTLRVGSSTEALCDRLLDYEENVRKQVVAAVCDVACHAFGAVAIETIKLVAERVRDKSVSASLLFPSSFIFFHVFTV